MDEQQLAAITAMQKGGLNKADMAGLFGANMQLNPYMLGAGVVSALPSLQQNIKQNQLLKELQKRGPQDITPQAFREYQAALNNQANNAKIAGYGAALENINRASNIGNVLKTAPTASAALRGALALNQQGIQARNQLDIQGAQAQQARQAAANQAMLQRGQFQEQGRKEYGSAVSALRGAKAQNWNNFIQGLSGAALNSFVIGAPKTTTPNVDEFPNTNPNNVAVPIVGKTPYMENQWFSNNKGPAFNPNAAATPTMMAPQAANMGAVATPVTSGLLPTPPQEQPSTIPNFLNAPSGSAPKNWVEFAMNRRANMTEQGLTNSPMRPVTTEPTMQAPVAAAPAPVAPAPAAAAPIVAPASEGRDISSPVNAAPAPATVAPVAPAPVTPAVDNAPAPPLNRNKAYSKPLTRATSDGGKIVYGPDGIATEYTPNGKEYKIGYRVLDNGRIATEDNDSPTDLKSSVPHYNKNDRQSLIKRLFNYGKNTSSPVNAAPAPAAAAPVAPTDSALPPVVDSVYSEPVTRKDGKGNPVVYGKDGIVNLKNDFGVDVQKKYTVDRDGIISYGSIVDNEDNYNKFIKSGIKIPPIKNNVFLDKYKRKDDYGNKYIYGTDGVMKFVSDRDGSTFTQKYTVDKYGNITLGNYIERSGRPWTGPQYNEDVKY